MLRDLEGLNSVVNAEKKLIKAHRDHLTFHHTLIREGFAGRRFGSLAVGRLVAMSFDRLLFDEIHVHGGRKADDDRHRDYHLAKVSLVLSHRLLPYPPSSSSNPNEVGALMF